MSKRKNGSGLILLKIDGHASVSQWGESHWELDPAADAAATNTTPEQRIAALDELWDEADREPPAPDLFAGQPAPPDAGHYGEGR